MSDVADQIIKRLKGKHGMTPAYDAFLMREAATEIKRLETIIRKNLEHSADGVLLCTHEGDLHCPRCGLVVRDEYGVCYCDTCPNPDSYGMPPLPLFYSQCFVDKTKVKVVER